MKTRREKVCNTPECRRMRELLSDFLDRSLHSSTARSLAAHLAACPPCALYVVSVEKTILLYRARPVVDVPAAVRDHLRELLRERHEAAPKKRGGRCRAGAAEGTGSRKTAAKRLAGKR